MRISIIPIGSSEFNKKVLYVTQSLKKVIDREKFNIEVKQPIASHLKLAEHFLDNAPAQFFPPQQLQALNIDFFPLKNIDLRIPLILLQEKGDWSNTGLERALLHEFGHTKCGTKVWADLRLLMCIVQRHYSHYPQVSREIGHFINVINWFEPHNYQPSRMLSEVYAERFMFENTSEQKEAIAFWHIDIERNRKKIMNTKNWDRLCFWDKVLVLFYVSTLGLISQTELSRGFFSTISNEIKSFSDEMAYCAYESKWRRFLELFILVQGENHSMKNIENLVEIVSRCTQTMDDELIHYYPLAV